MKILIITILIFFVWLLILNLQEFDYYPYSVSEKEDFTCDELPFVHPQVSCQCECNGCNHTFKIRKNTRFMRLTDKDGWYRLFWTKDDTHFYKDPSFFAKALENPTAEKPEGEWYCEFIYEKAAAQATKHSCNQKQVYLVKFLLRLKISHEEKTFETVNKDGIQIPSGFFWIRRGYATKFHSIDVETSLNFYWVLDTFDIEYKPCECGS